ncbi:MAG: hypothetical protein WB760_24130 [Xanthobacteraceae bacterium]
MLLLVLSALPLVLALGLLPIPPGSSPARLGERAAWQWTLLQNTPESYRWFYSNWASEEARPVVAQLIDDAAWARAARANKYDDYAAYISAYSPGGRHIEDAVNAADGLFWTQVDSIGTTAAYNAYLEQFPQGRHAREAQDDLEEIAWRQIAGNLTIDNLSEFISEFPAGRHLADAQNALAALRQKEADAEQPSQQPAQAPSPFGPPPAPPGAVTGSLGGSTDGVPAATNVFVVGAPVPLPRPRPRFLATAEAGGDVPLPRPRPKSLAPETAPNPLGWLQNLLQPH